jgi:catechol 2,3-dioxygenase-like lactoylglutathione lyase family enzyme
MTDDRRVDIIPRIGIDHLVLVASDVETTLDFYVRVLGGEARELTEWRAGEVDYPVLHFGSWKFNVHPVDTTAGPRAMAPAAGALDIALRWDGDVRSAMAHLGDVGVAVIEGPVAQEGARGLGESVYFRDPDGALIEFICYPRDEMLGTEN